MKIVFFGSSKYSTIVQKALYDKFGLLLSVTAPDKPKGRKRKLTPTPVKEFALKNKILLITPAKLTEEVIDNIAKVKPDFLAVCDYGLILPLELLKLPKYDALNVHHSLLPKYRGPSPAPATILAGDEKSGVTIISMSEDVDAGDILTQKEYILKEDETTDSLLTKLNTLGGQLVIKVIENYLAGSIQKTKQDNSKATYTHRLTKQNGLIDLLNLPNPIDLDRMIRAYYPWPGVWSKLKIQNSKLRTIKFLPGNLIQPEGKRAMTITEFKNGYPQAYEQIKHLINNEAQSF